MKKKYVPHGRTRQHKIEVRLNDEEYFKLEDTISLMGTNRSEYLRKLIVGTRIKEKPPDNFYKNIKEFSLMGSNLNQIAERINTITKIEDWEYEDIDPKDIYEYPDKIGIKPNEISKFGFNLQANIQRKELN